MKIFNIDKNNFSNIYIDGVIIKCNGYNNILVLGENCKFKNTMIQFSGNNSLIFIDKSNKIIEINADIYNDCCLYLGKNIFYNNAPKFIISEHSHCIIGDNCILSFGLFFRTSDAHPIYNINTMERINFSKSIFIGDNVWIGQNALILKGSKVGSGAIIGAYSVISNKNILSNSIVAGNPVKYIKKDCAFIPLCTHSYFKSDSESIKTVNISNYVFNNSGNMFLIDKKLLSSNSIEERIDIINDMIQKNYDKNRFCITL